MGAGTDGQRDQWWPAALHSTTSAKKWIWGSCSGSRASAPSAAKDRDDVPKAGGQARPGQVPARSSQASVLDENADPGNGNEYEGLDLLGTILGKGTLFDIGGVGMCCTRIDRVGPEGT